MRLSGLSYEGAPARVPDLRHTSRLEITLDGSSEAWVRSLLSSRTVPVGGKGAGRKFLKTTASRRRLKIRAPRRE